MSKATRSQHRRRLPKKPNHAKVWRFYLVFFLFLGITLGIIGKLLYLQVVESDALKQKVRQARSQSVVLFNRGRVLDRNGVILAQDTLLYDLFAHPRYYGKFTPAQIAQGLSQTLDLPVEVLTQKLSEPYSTIGVIKNIHKTVMDQIRETRLELVRVDKKSKQPLRNKDGSIVTSQLHIPGLDFVRKPVRNYPQGSLAAHVLGYVHDEANVSSGVEAAAKHILRKIPEGMEAAQFNGRGDFINLEALSPENIVTLPKSEDVTLTLDARLQYVAERELAAGIERTKAQRGAVVMMNPRNGEVLAFAVVPNYEPETFFKAPAVHLKNWAMTDVYPPGSTFKILTVACGLESGAIKPDSKILDTGKMTVGGWEIRNYDYSKRGAPGMIDLVYLLQHSSNIASAKIAMQIPPKKHRELLQRFGMGKKTGIDLPGESSGILRPAEDWDQSTHATLGFGYGLASTPLQMAAAVAAIANEGVWNQPHVIKGTKTEPSRRVLSKETARTVTRLLAESIETAPSSTVKLKTVKVAGKTGTSRKPKENGRGYDTNLFTSFVGFFPAEDPQVLMMVVVDSPTIAEAWGSTVAGPIFASIAEETISYMGMKPARIASPPPAPKPPAPTVSPEPLAPKPLRGDA